MSPGTWLLAEALEGVRRGGRVAEVWEGMRKGVEEWEGCGGFWKSAEVVEVWGSVRKGVEK